MFLGYATLPTITTLLEFSGQEVELLIDINSAETFLIKYGTRDGLQLGYDPSEAGDDFKDLEVSYNWKIENDVDDHSSEIWGSIGKATIGFLHFNETATFAVIDKLAEDPTTVSKYGSIHGGRIGLNPWQEGFTNGSNFLFGEPRQDFVFLASCSEDE